MILKAVTFAMAVFFISRNKKRQETYKGVCVCNEVLFFDYGSYMCRVARMILAYVFAVKCAIALLLISRRKKMQEGIRTSVF